ncbi:MAG: phosphoenolpyruvate--protein phosphotransferase [Pseudomonadota bacterium]
MMQDQTLASPLAGWVTTLSAVPDPVFAQGMMGSGIAIDPVGDTLHAPCAGVVTSIHAAHHAVSLTTDAGAELLMHIGIDSVAMAGDGFVRLVAAGDRVAAGQPLVRFDLDLLVRRARSAMTPVLLVGEGFALTPLTVERLVAVGDPVVRLTRTADTAAATIDASAAGAWQALTVALPHGIHARPAARIAAVVRGRDAVVTLVCGEARASALSMTGLIGLGAGFGATVSIEAQGSEADAVAAAIAEILTATVDPDAIATPARASATVAVEPGTLPGVAAVPGLAIGTARWLRPAAIDAPAGSGDIDAERVAFARGLSRLKATLDGDSGVMAAHRALLDDPDLLGAIDGAIADGHGAAAAVLSVTAAQAATLARNADPRIAERGDDLSDIGQRLAHAILGTRPDTIRIDPGTVLLADDLLPSQLSALEATPPAAIAVVRGGPTSHVAIMAAAQGIPMVVALGTALRDIADGATVIVDGDTGFVRADPDGSQIAAAESRIARASAAEAHARAAGDGRPATTRDGHAIGVHVNLGSATEAAAAVADGAEGCGLLRTELLFLDRATPPTRAEQAAEYRAIATAMAGRPLTIRLLDVGGDKPAPYLAIPREDNPALGLRGVRVGLAHPDGLEAQVAAILDAADAGPLRIMVPMVSSVAEIEAVRSVVDRLRGERAIRLGAMIETPAAAIGADLIAASCDFLSIGSNDLTQYVLAMDRGNAAVAGGLDGLHPSVLRLIAETCARSRVPVGVCGGLAADPLAVPILVGLGVTSLSVPPVRIAATRALVAGLSYTEAVPHARAALDLPSAAAVRGLARASAEGTAA